MQASLVILWLIKDNKIKKKEDGVLNSKIKQDMGSKCGNNLRKIIYLILTWCERISVLAKFTVLLATVLEPLN